MCYGNILESAVRHARVDHRCLFCGRTIVAGEVYQTFVFANSTDSDGIVRQKQCLDCAAKLDLVESDDGCIYDLRQLAREEIERSSWGDFRRALRNAKAALIAQLKPRRRAAGGGS